MKLNKCLRDERFCDGFREAVIEEGIIRNLLERLQEIRINNS